MHNFSVDRGLGSFSANCVQAHIFLWAILALERETICNSSMI